MAAMRTREMGTTSASFCVGTRKFVWE